MITCELCGRTSEKLVISIVEGARMNSCENCSKFGNIIKEKTFFQNNRRFESSFEDTDDDIISNYNIIIKNKREQLNLTQDDLAIKIKEKSSLIRKLERGELKPTIELAKRFEKLFGIRLITKIGIAEKTFNDNKNINFTIGDIIKRK